MTDEAEVGRVVGTVGGRVGAGIREARRARRWTIRRLAAEAGISPSLPQWVEAGHAASLETYVRLAAALRRRLEIDLIDPRRRGPGRDEDPVHAAMGEVEARMLRERGFGVSLDEPYQHFQFAGRADVVAWNVERSAVLHIENRTRLPNFQEAAGVYNAKRRWLGASIAERLNMRRFRSESHVLVGLWSAEMLHVARLRRPSLAAICPDSMTALGAWLTGSPPSAGVSSCFVLFDPVRGRRANRRSIIDLATALDPKSRPRYRGYAEAAETFRREGLG